MSELEVISSPDVLSPPHTTQGEEKEIEKEIEDDYDEEDYFDDVDYEKDVNSDVEKGDPTKGDAEGQDEQQEVARERERESKEEIEGGEGGGEGGEGAEGGEEEGGNEEEEIIEEMDIWGEEGIAEDAQEAQSGGTTPADHKKLQAKKENTFAKKAQQLRESAEKRKAMRHLAEQRKQQKLMESQAEEEARKKKLKEAEYKKLLELKRRVREEGARQNFNPNQAPETPFQTSVSKSVNNRLAEQREENLKKIKKREFTSTSHKMAVQEIKNIKETTILRKEAGLSKAGESQNFQESLNRIKAQDDEEVRMNLTRELKTGYEKERASKI